MTQQTVLAGHPSRFPVAQLLSEAFMIVDAETLGYVEANTAACDCLGMPRDRILARADWEVDASLGTPERARAWHEELIAQAPGVRTRETALRRADGSAVVLEQSQCAVQVDGTWVIATAGRDVAEQRRAQAELRRRADELARSNRDLERFAYVASHDLSEPLRMVASYTQLLERRYGPQLDDEARGYIGAAVDGARRMKRLIDGLLSYSRAGRADRPLKPVDMNSVLDDALQSLAASMPQAMREARLARCELPVVEGDAPSLAQLLAHLLGNAMKFVRGRAPHVTLSCERDEGRWAFAVRDNGIGIDPADAGRMFELFQRLHGPAGFDGDGVGLATCKKIVERHGGRIWAQSAPGEGSAFFFTLRAVPVQAQAQAQAQARASASNEGEVLR